LTTTSAVFGDPFDLTGSAVSQAVDGTGFRGGKSLCWFQLAIHAALGIEGDVGIANQATALSENFTPVFRTAVAADSTSMKTTWDASLRRRVGTLLTPATLAYATGGVA
jgi:outer membrane immunogenic protein